MPDAMPTLITDATAGGQTPPGSTAPVPGAQQPGHHSAAQPRDQSQRFAGPPGTSQEKPKADPPAGPRKIPVRFQENGQEVAEELTEEQLVQAYRERRALAYKEKLATERLQRAGELSKESEQARAVAEAIEKGDYSKLREYYAKKGVQPVDVLAQLLQQALDERDMDPKDRELAQLRAEKAQQEAERKQRDEQAMTAEFQKGVDEWRVKLHNTWGTILEKSDLPKTERTLEVASEIFLEALEATGGKNMPSDEQIIELTRNAMLEQTAKPLIQDMSVGHFLKHFGGEGGIVAKLDKELTPEQLVQSFPALAQRFHRYLVGQAKAQARGGNRPARQNTEATPGAPAPEGGSAMDPFFLSRLNRAG